MQFYTKAKGAALAACQLAIIGTVISGGIAFLFFWLGAAVFALWLAACFILYYRLRRCQIVINKKELSLCKGLFFPATLRVPLRFITACHIIQTPLQRVAGVCFCFLISSGTFAMLWGLDVNDAKTMYAQIRMGQAI